jgi:hypothetical protein
MDQCQFYQEPIMQLAALDAAAAQQVRMVLSRTQRLLRGQASTPKPSSHSTFSTKSEWLLMRYNKVFRQTVNYLPGLANQILDGFLLSMRP